jgi:hypothetical protein
VSLQRRRDHRRATDAAGDTSEFSLCASYLNYTIFAGGFNPPPG